jgi:hypothetical protein
MATMCSIPLGLTEHVGVDLVKQDIANELLKRRPELRHFIARRFGQWRSPFPAVLLEARNGVFQFLAARTLLWFRPLPSRGLFWLRLPSS